MTKYNSRKLVAVSLGFITGIIFACFGMLTKELVEFIIIMVSIYISGNILGKVASVFESIKKNQPRM